jgi:hypothetical protein
VTDGDHQAESAIVKDLYKSVGKILGLGGIERTVLRFGDNLYLPNDFAGDKLILPNYKQLSSAVDRAGIFRKRHVPSGHRSALSLVQRLAKRE